MTTTPSSLQIIVLHTIKHKENGLVVQCYTNRGGRESLFIKYSNKSKVKINLSQLHPLAILNAELSVMKLGSMQSIKEATPIVRLASIRGDIYKSSIALFISELIMRSIREIEENAQLYEFLSNAVLTLENIREGVSNFHPWFLVNFCRHLGYSPKIERMPQGELFDIVTAEYIRTPDSETICFDETDSMLLYRFFKASAQVLTQIKIDGKKRHQFIGQMIKYLSFHIGSELKIESLDVLHEVFE
ncbi:MAG TPA: DNA repair protein RecO [Rikenellaceae bacterium]|nr:DNA repair protein RecO [Rikenellaceae bacterium]